MTELAAPRAALLTGYSSSIDPIRDAASPIARERPLLRAPLRDPARAAPLAATRPPFRFPPRFDDLDAFDLPLELVFLFATSCLLGE